MPERMADGNLAGAVAIFAIALAERRCQHIPHAH